MRSRITRVIVGVTAIALTLAGCSSSSSKSSGKSLGDKITLGLIAEPASLDFTTTDGAAIPQALMDNVYETLVRVNDKSGKIVPALAKSWTVSDDRLTYDFDLVDNAKFSNGQKFTADDAVFSINYVKTKWTTSVKAAMAVVASATAVSPTKLEVKLSKPSNNWLYKMTTRIGAMMTQAGVADLANKPIGTGPYTFVSWTRGDSMQFARNEDYWGKKPQFKNVVLKYFTDPTAMNNALLSGSIDVVTTLQTPESLDQFTTGANKNKYQVIDGTTNGEVVLSMNEANPDLADLKVRQAIRYGIDHKALLNNCWAGKGTLIGSMAPPTDPWYQDRTGDFPYDPNKAKSLLQEAGKTNITLRLRLPTLPYATACGPEVKSQLSKIGITVNIDTLEFPAAWLKTVFTNHDFDMSIVAHVEPRDAQSVFGTPGYYTSFNNPQVNALFASADSGTPAQQITDMESAEKQISEDAAADFLFLLPNLVVAKKAVNGMPKNAITESLRFFELS